MIGTPAISGIIIIERSGENSLPRNMDMIAIMLPRKSDPVSPMNVLAGEMLNWRNPVTAPARIQHIIRTDVSPPQYDKTAKVISAIDDNPPTRPSIPSIILKAFVRPRIQKTDIMFDNQSGKLKRLKKFISPKLILKR